MKKLAAIFLALSLCFTQVSFALAPASEIRDGAFKGPYGKQENQFVTGKAAELGLSPQGAQDMLDQMEKIRNFTVSDMKVSIVACLGKPTIRVDFTLFGGAKGHFVVPAGTSTGEDEAQTVGVEKAKENLDKLHREITNRKITADQLVEIARVMLEMGKDELGAEPTLSYQMAAAWAAARQSGLEPYELIRQLAPDLASKGVPKTKIQYNITNGGEHADNSLDMQEFMVVPIGSTTADSNRMCDETDMQLGLIYQGLGLSADPDDKGMGDKRGKEGGYKIADLTRDKLKDIYANADKYKIDNLNITSLKQEKTGVHEFVLNCMLAAIKNAGYKPSASGEVGTVSFALDSAATSMLVEGHQDLYHYEGDQITSEQLVGIYAEWVEKYPIDSIEDGMGENDWEGWMSLIDRIADKTMLIGDDNLVTQAGRLTKLIGLLEEKGFIGDDGKVTKKLGILIKLNQNGFLTTGINDPDAGYLGTLEVIRLARKYGIDAIVSHRSKEPGPEENEVSIAELAAGVDAYALKSGDHVQPTRQVKEDRLEEIDDREREKMVIETYPLALQKHAEREEEFKNEYEWLEQVEKELRKELKIQEEGSIAYLLIGLEGDIENMEGVRYLTKAQKKKKKMMDILRKYDMTSAQFRKIQEAKEEGLPPMPYGKEKDKIMDAVRKQLTEAGDKGVPISELQKTFDRALAKDALEDTLKAIDKPFVLLMGTDWLNAAVGQKDAINPLITSLRRYLAKRKITLITAKDVELLDSVAEGTGELVVLADKQTITAKNVALFENKARHVYPFAIDAQQLTTDGYIPLIEIVTFALRSSIESRFITHPTDLFTAGKYLDIWGTYWQITISPAEPLDPEQLKKIYQMQKFA